MTRKTGSRFLDSSAWLAYFFKESKVVKDIIDGESIFFTSSISLFEISRKLRKLNVDSHLERSFLDFIQERSIIIDVDAVVSLSALNWPELHTVDAFIYASAVLQNSILVTADFDFKKLDRVELIEKQY